MPAAALQLLATPYASATFALACGTAPHLSPAPRRAPKEGAVRGRRRPDPTGACDFPTVAAALVNFMNSVIPWLREASGFIVAADPYSKAVKLAPRRPLTLSDATRCY